MSAHRTEWLPYRDTKPQGAPDFYFCINATFRFLYAKMGREGWIDYLQHLGREYFHPVNESWRSGGFAALAGYWREFFAAEPGADVEVEASEAAVEIHVKCCPVLKHLREHGREIFPHYCQHCFILGSARAEAAGFEMRLEGGNGSCVHRYQRKGELPPQDWAKIREAGPC